MPKPELYSIKRTALPLRQTPWTMEDNRVILQVPKFRGKTGEMFCRILRRPSYITVHLDFLGSFVWERCDGRHTVEDILHELEHHFGEKDLEARLIQFLYDLTKNGLVTL